MSVKRSENKTIRTDEEKTALILRLNRIEGQVRGIKRMLDEDAYCNDLLVQVSAVSSALNSLGELMLMNHLKNCVASDLKAGNTEKLEEVISILHKMLK
ncbi:metal-sensing transcriptional repressor [Treponema sp.]|uniref:metal-sensing transcriptional repressor n=1 Tax=Treponema sp. TaxID=166 RepID=UPI00388D20A3